MSATRRGLRVAKVLVVGLAVASAGTGCSRRIGDNGDGGIVGPTGPTGPAGPMGDPGASGHGQLRLRDATGVVVGRGDAVLVDDRKLLWTLDPLTGVPSGIHVERVYYAQAGCTGTAYLGLPNGRALALIEPRVPFLVWSESALRVRPDTLKSEARTLPSFTERGGCVETTESGFFFPLDATVPSTPIAVPEVSFAAPIRRELP